MDILLHLRTSAKTISTMTSFHKNGWLYRNVTPFTKSSAHSFIAGTEKGKDLQVELHHLLASPVDLVILVVETVLLIVDETCLVPCYLRCTGWKFLGQNGIDVLLSIVPTQFLEEGWRRTR
jgi:hypothetical protein